VNGGWLIAFRPNAPDLNFVIAHECGHLALRLAEIAVDDAQEEDRANRIAAALLAPKDALEVALKESGERLAPVARHFGMTQSSVALRVGCARDESAAVVAPTHVHAVGTLSAHPDREIRAMSLAKTLPADMRLARLTGSYDKGRVAIQTRRARY
jgi:hypothetical protein